MSEVTEITYLRSMPLEKICDTIKTRFKNLEKDNERLCIQLKELTDEKWKDEELQKMKKQRDLVYANARRGFPISESEYEAAQNWIKNHEVSKHPRPEGSFPRGGAVGGCYTWIFTPTSIGTFGSVKCNCGESFTFQEEA